MQKGGVKKTANICCFRMSVKGDKSNISKFTSALTQDGEVWMGRGAEADIDFLSDSEAEIEGCCKWSIQSALIDDSFSMRRQKETGEGYWGDLDTSKGFISLFEACEEYHVNMEVGLARLAEQLLRTCRRSQCPKVVKRIAKNRN